MPLPRVVTVGASEPDGDTGVHADLMVLAALACRGSAVVTATVTPGTGEAEVHALPARVVRAQIEAAVAASPAAVKVGVAADADTVGVLASAARAGALPRLVVDPVLAGPTGRRRNLVAAYRRLLPFATVVTPNLDEASALVGWSVAEPASMGGAASQLAAEGAEVVVVTGGALPGDQALDVAWVGNGVRQLRGRRVPGEIAPPPGAGGVFSAAVAAALAYGLPAVDAVEYAKLYAAGLLARAATGGGFDYFQLDGLPAAIAESLPGSSRPPGAR